MQLMSRSKHTNNNYHSKTLLGGEKIIVAVRFHSRLQMENADGLFMELMISGLFTFISLMVQILNHQIFKTGYILFDSLFPIIKEHHREYILNNI